VGVIAVVVKARVFADKLDAFRRQIERDDTDDLHVLRHIVRRQRQPRRERCGGEQFYKFATVHA
jgi:hypothetical protein